MTTRQCRSAKTSAKAKILQSTSTLSSPRPSESIDEFGAEDATDHEWQNSDDSYAEPLPSPPPPFSIATTGSFVYGAPPVNVPEAMPKSFAKDAVRGRVYADFAPLYVAVQSKPTMDNMPPPYHRLEDIYKLALGELLVGGFLNARYELGIVYMDFNDKGTLADASRPEGRPGVMWNNLMQEWVYAVYGYIVLCGKGETEPGGRYEPNAGKNGSTPWRLQTRSAWEKQKLERFEWIYASDVPVDFKRVVYPVEMNAAAMDDDYRRRLFAVQLPQTAAIEHRCMQLHTNGPIHRMPSAKAAEDVDYAREPLYASKMFVYGYTGAVQRSGHVQRPDAYKSNDLYDQSRAEVTTFRRPDRLAQCSRDRLLWSKEGPAEEPTLTTAEDSPPTDPVSADAPALVRAGQLPVESTTRLAQLPCGTSEVAPSFTMSALPTIGPNTTTVRYDSLADMFRVNVQFLLEMTRAMEYNPFPFEDMPAIHVIWLFCRSILQPDDENRQAFLKAYDLMMDLCQACKEQDDQDTVAQEKVDAALDAIRAQHVDINAQRTFARPPIARTDPVLTHLRSSRPFKRQKINPFGLESKIGQQPLYNPIADCVNSDMESEIHREMSRNRTNRKHRGDHVE